MENLHRDLLKERERGREKKSKSRDLSNRSLKTDGETEQRTYIVIHIRKTSLKTDRRTDSGEPTQGPFKRETGEERKRARAEI